MPVKIWLPWKPQVTWTVVTWLSQVDSAKFGSVCFDIKKVINVQSRCGQNPPPPPPPGLDRVKPAREAHSCHITNIEPLAP